MGDCYGRARGRASTEKATPVAIEDARKLQSYIAAFEAEKHSAAVSSNSRVATLSS